MRGDVSRQIAFHATWTMRNRRTGTILLTDHTLASGPVSTRELAQRICDVEQARRTREETSVDIEHAYEVIERPLEAATFWDDCYGEEWMAAQSRWNKELTP